MGWQSSSLTRTMQHGWTLLLPFCPINNGSPICSANLVPILSLKPELPPPRSGRLRRRRPSSLLQLDSEVQFPSQMSQWDVCPSCHLHVGWSGDWIVYDLSKCTSSCSTLNFSSQPGHPKSRTTVKRSNALVHVVCRNTCLLITRIWDRKALTWA